MNKSTNSTTSAYETNPLVKCTRRKLARAGTHNRWNAKRIPVSHAELVCDSPYLLPVWR